MEFIDVIQKVYDDLLNKYKKSSKEKERLKGKYDRKICNRVDKYYYEIISFKRFIKNDFPYIIEMFPLGYVYDTNIVDFKYYKDVKSQDFLNVINDKIQLFRDALNKTKCHKDDILDDLEAFIGEISKWFSKIIERDEIEIIYRYKDDFATDIDS